MSTAFRISLDGAQQVPTAVSMKSGLARVLADGSRTLTSNWEIADAHSIALRRPARRRHARCRCPALRGRRCWQRHRITHYA